MGLLDRFKKDKVLKQELDKNGVFSILISNSIFSFCGYNEINQRRILLKGALNIKFGNIDIVSGDKSLTLFALKKYTVKFKEGFILAGFDDGSSTIQTRNY